MQLLPVVQEALNELASAHHSGLIITLALVFPPSSHSEPATFSGAYQPCYWNETHTSYPENYPSWWENWLLPTYPILTTQPLPNLPGQVSSPYLIPFIKLSIVCNIVFNFHLYWWEENHRKVRPSVSPLPLCATMICMAWATQVTQ